VIEARTIVCRLCETPLPKEPELHLANVPARIQTFPDPRDLAADRGTDLRAFQCRGCGHVQLASQPVIYSQGVTSTTRYSPSMLAHRRGQMRAWVQTHGLAGKRVLEVGCGDGHLLDILRAEGARAVGVDASEKALELARAHGHEVELGYVRRGHALSAGPFDAFVSNDVIEHVPDIKDFLQGVAENLAPGAVGLVETPSLEQVLETRRFFDFMQDHLAYFTVGTLRLAFELSGFEVLAIERNREGENLTAHVRRRAPLDFAPLRAHQRELVQELGEFLRAQRAAGRRVALWGASIQTLTLAALMPLEGVVYVVDSAPYKQGQLTQVSHLPIVAPEHLASDPVDVIVVNAPRYADEIVRQIREQVRFRGTLASLVSGNVRILAG
jgi:SAM-dependent methyltransferase